MSVFAARSRRPSPIGLTPVRLDDFVDAEAWVETAPLADAAEGNTLLFLADPFSVYTLEVLHALAERRPDIAVIGGMASAARAGREPLVLDDQVVTDGAVGVAPRTPPRRSARSCRRAAARSASRSPSPGRAQRDLRARRPARAGPAARDRAQPRPEDLRARRERPAPRSCRRRAPARLRAAATSSCATCSASTSERGDRGRRRDRRRHDRAVPGARRRVGRRGPARAAQRRAGGRRADVHVQRPRHAPVRRARPRRRLVDEVLGTVPLARDVLRGRDRSRRRPQLPPRLHRVARAVRASDRRRDRATPLGPGWQPPVARVRLDRRKGSP